MNALQLKAEFIDILQPLGAGSGDFFLAASLYHSRKVSFAAAAGLAGLGLDEFNYRLREHFGRGFLMDDEIVEEDLATVRQLRDRIP
jgi:hypothetical protein